MTKPCWLWMALAPVVAALILQASYVSIAEESTVFCTSCHLRSEQTFYERALVKSRNDAVDLASAHALAGVNCVGCHRGDQGAGDRVISLALGARNTAKFFTRQYDPNHSQVAAGFLLDDGCKRCHVSHPELGGVKPGNINPVMTPGFDNHFHLMLFDPKTKTSVTCTTCHPAHQEGFPELQFIERDKVVLSACERCHREVGRGPAGGLQ